MHIFLLEVWSVLNSSYSNRTFGEHCKCYLPLKKSCLALVPHNTLRQWVPANLMTVRSHAEIWGVLLLLDCRIGSSGYLFFFLFFSSLLNISMTAPSVYLLCKPNIFRCSVCSEVSLRGQFLWVGALKHGCMQKCWGTPSSSSSHFSQLSNTIRITSPVFSRMAELPEGGKVMEEFLEGCRWAYPAYFDGDALTQLVRRQREGR